MLYPDLTATYAAFFALFYLLLSMWVIGGRINSRVLFGDGGQEAVLRSMRSHGNFTEYVPFILLLVGWLEMGHTSRFIIHALLLPLLIARLAHPVGMMAPANSPLQFVCRGGGMIVTLFVLLATAVLLLLHGS